MRVEPRIVFEQVIDAARSRGVSEVEAIIASDSNALTRFANNEIHQNVAEQCSYVSVRPVLDGRTARATTNRLDAEAIHRVVEQAIVITRLTAPDPDLLPLATPVATPVPLLARWFEETARATPADRARDAAAAISVAQQAGQTAAGTCSTGESVFAILNSRGLALEHRETMARFSITAMAPDSSGWAKAGACRYGSVDPFSLAKSAMRKAELSRAPRELPAGRYTVVLEPAAVLDL